MAKKSTPPKIAKLPTAKQRRLDALLDKNNEGTITSSEKAKLEELVAEAERLMIANAKRLAQFAKRHGAPVKAIPVTVWIEPSTAER